MKKVLFLIIIFSSGSIILSQPDSISVQQSLEPLLEDVTVDNENEVILDLIEYLSKNPIAINSASIDELMRIPFMDYNSATIIINFRNSGIITSLDQLRKIEGLNGDLVEKISPYIRFTISSIHAASKKLTDDFEKFKFSLRTREQLYIQANAGTVSGKFTGSPWKIYNRVELDKGNKINIT